MADNNVQKTDSTALRRRAEDQLGEETATKQSLGTEDDPQKLYHELQVHQVELEMQNTELRHTRDQLEEALEQYTDLYDFAPVGYLTLDREGTISRVNFTAAGLMGLDRSRLVGRLFGSLVVGEARPTFDSFLGRVFASLAKETCEVALLKEGNSPLFVKIEAKVDSNGQECRIAMIDITESMLVRKSIQIVEEISDEALRSVEKSAALAILKVEEDTEEALRKAEGISESQETIELARLLVEGDTELARLLVEREIEIARLKVVETVKELQLDEKTTGAMLNKIKAAVEVAKTKVEKAAWVAQRVVLMEKANHELRQQKEMADASNRVKSQFLANMSHELRTPMTGVLGMLDVVLLGNLEVEQRECLEVAHTSSCALVRILNDILDMTKIEAGKFTLEERPISLRKCAVNILNIYLPVAKSKGLELDFTVDDNVPQTLVGDQVRINQILTNLASNAIKFTEKGNVAMRVTAGSSRPGGKREVTFTVSDTGIGIPEDKKHLLFRCSARWTDHIPAVTAAPAWVLPSARRLLYAWGVRSALRAKQGKGAHSPAPCFSERLYRSVTPSPHQKSRHRQRTCLSQSR
ncbi:MAG: hypothetical protein H7X83_01565 [Verrucomicrobia bacterium]|nr:hypothetical protein [Deltaproteobacteria bacterium]